MKDRPHEKQVVQVTAAGNPSPRQRSPKAEQAVEPVRAIEMHAVAISEVERSEPASRFGAA
jgi:hypothetical protein